MRETLNWRFGRLNTNREIRPLLLNGERRGTLQLKDKETRKKPVNSLQELQMVQNLRKWPRKVLVTWSSKHWISPLPWFLLTFSFLSRTPTDNWAEKILYTQSRELVSSGKIGQKGMGERSSRTCHVGHSGEKQNKTKQKTLTDYPTIDDKNQHLSGTVLKHTCLR